MLTDLTDKLKRQLDLTDNNRLQLERMDISDEDVDQQRQPPQDSQTKDNFGKTMDMTAQRAAEEAKAASDAQGMAALQAAHQVKSQLAEKATHAARAAESAVLSSQGLVDNIKQQLNEAESVVNEEMSSLSKAAKILEVTNKAAEESREELKSLGSVVRFAQDIAANAEEVSQGAEFELNEKNKLMSAAKSRVSELMQKLNEAKANLAGTRRAAQMASNSAHEAQVNAARNRRHA